MPFTDPNSKWPQQLIDWAHSEALHEDYLRQKIPCRGCRKDHERRQLEDGYCDDCIVAAAADVLAVCALTDVETDVRGIGLDELRNRAADLARGKGLSLPYQPGVGL